MKKILIFLVKFYQKYISGLKSAPSCRFIPTCSEYALQAITKYGAIKGSYLALRRVLKCHPFHKGGYDPVP
ncbi:MAG: membrane protein insertion efficiency factor YidD [Ruminococcaceae bacterium]|nr:membrane protein insertion efficiency factor YidD [Oscillospiraceae bacterium]